MEKPKKEKYGYVENNSFDTGGECGWTIEGGEEAYEEALKKWNFMQTELCCSACGSNDVKYEKRSGRGLLPKAYKSKLQELPHPLMPKRLISWKGLWNFYICNKCGNEWKKIIETD